MAYFLEMSSIDRLIDSYAVGAPSPVEPLWVIKTVPEHKIVETLIEEAMRIAEEAGEQAEAGSPTVTVG